MEREAEFGDFQTPAAFAAEICGYLLRTGVKPAHIIEPNCGKGTFLQAAASLWEGVTVEGFEINSTHLEIARQALSDAVSEHKAKLYQQDFFLFDWHSHIKHQPENFLILGNPPWVTNSTLAKSGGTNLPNKTNFQNLRGLDAITGKANFDIAEWMLIRLIEAAKPHKGTIAMLCKASTARKVLRDGWLRDGRIANAKIIGIDSAKHFGVAVDACLLVARLGAEGVHRAEVFVSLDASAPSSVMGLVGTQLVSDLDAYESLRTVDGHSPFVWRSGIKHDCARVMEFVRESSGRYKNGMGEPVSIEDEFIYPFIKSTGLSKGLVQPSRSVLVTQRRTGDDTRLIEQRLPRTWAYLQAHSADLELRKSSIYRKRPPFSIFGIGDYAFAPFKVAVSALHQSPRFFVVPESGDKPVMLDDTCYYLPFHSADAANAAESILNSETTQRFIKSLSFAGSKRIVTAELLQRINLRVVAEREGLNTAWSCLESQFIPIRRNDMPVQAVLAMEPKAEYRA